MLPARPEARDSRWAWAVPLVALALVLATALADPRVLQGLRNTVFDQYQRWHPRDYRDPAVRIVDIDEESLRRIGQWPWPRERVAQLLDEIGKLGAASTAIDAVFAEPDRTTLRMNGDAAPRAAAAAAAADDPLARALGRGNVAIGFAMSSRRSARPDGTAQDDGLQLKAGFFALGGDPLPFVPEFPAIIPNLPELQRSAAGQGAMTFVPDADGIVRRVPLLMNLDGRLVPSLVAEALRLAAHASRYTVDSAGDGGGVIDVRIGERTLATDASGALWVHYSTPRPQRYMPAWQVLAHQVPPGRLAGHVVLVGTSAQGLLDLRFSPRGVIVPGVEVHAQALEQVLSGQRLNRPGWAPAVELIALLLGALAAGTIAMTRGAAVSSACAAALAAGMCAAAWSAFVLGHVLIDAVTPTLGLAGVFVPTMLVRHFLSERQQRWMRQAFSRYVSPNLVDYLIAHPEALELGGRRQRCSFVFADLAGFTALMERMDPSTAVTVLNGYLDRMIAIAFEHEGTLDRIVGDSIAIVFSAPIEQADHERRALRCALQMHGFARRYVDDLARRGVDFCQTRIGVHTGEVTVGNFGGGAIFDYRALGDPVNTAARLEGANKHLGTRVCVSDATLSACPDVPARPIGQLRLAGRSGYLRTWEPLEVRAGDATADADYRHAYDLMCAGSDDALAAFEALATARPDDPLAALHRRRLRAGQRGDLIELSEK